MPPNTKPVEGQAQAFLQPGVSYFQVLVPSTVLAPNGDTQYGMAGPWLDLPSANAFANTKPGSLITVTLVLHQAVGAPPASAVPPMRPIGKA